MPTTDVLEVKIAELEKAVKSELATVKEDVRDVRSDLKEVLGELRNSTRSIDETFKKLVGLEASSQSDKQTMARAFTQLDGLEKRVDTLTVEQAKEKTRLKILFAIGGALLPAVGFILEHYIKLP